MLLFIASRRLKSSKSRIIQIHLMLLFISLKILFNHGLTKNSNTSHVIVYLLPLIVTCPDSTFKYISCYCLSILFLIGKSNSTLFKYISCYCLSELRGIMNELIHIFKYISCYCLSGQSAIRQRLQTNSNTSHVIVYQIEADKEGNKGMIQIHLMLLFILIVII